MYNQYKVSVVVAIYKSEKFLDKLIKSIVRQTHRNLEIILVDDGSPDDSGAICDKYARDDERIVVIHKKNGGTCEARNTGIAQATGEYLVIIDGDDWLENDYVEYLLKMAVDTDSDMAMSDKIFTTRDRQQTENDCQEVWSAEKAATAIIYPYIPIGPWNKIYRISMLRENNITFSVAWSGEGLHYTVMSAQHSNQVAVGHRKIYNYRLNNAGSGLTNYNVQIGINALQNIKIIQDSLIIDTPKLRNAVKWHIWKNYYYLLFLIVATNSKKKYSKEYKECLVKIRLLFPRALIKSELGIKDKLRMIIKSCFPVMCAKKEISKSRKALSADLME